MRYTKATLLIFGLGLGLGFVAVVGAIIELERLASAAMALGLVLLPPALIADLRGGRILAWIAGRRSRRKGRRPRTSPHPRHPTGRRAARSRAAPRAARQKRG